MCLVGSRVRARPERSHAAPSPLGANLVKEEKREESRQRARLNDHDEEEDDDLTDFIKAAEARQLLETESRYTKTAS